MNLLTGASLLALAKSIYFYYQQIDNRQLAKRSLVDIIAVKCE